MKLIIASRNIHKIREMRSMLKEKGSWDLYSLIDFPDYHPPEETGTTFEENAILKAIHAAKELDDWVLADDSGLVIPALQGAPGVFSARYAGSASTDKENRTKLLQEMQSLKDEERAGYFACAIALASPNGLENCVTARCEGTITEEERGGQGFGYDPLFKRNDYNKTFAELEEEIKNRISHRRKALDKMLIHLESRALSH
ncbi:MAG: Non-canonical purine NTP pyrophosphatase [Chlamydiae bacterium]|nr:Non-canonical purine NTP pyrophosphatase [Chlamydiota bacterium]